MSDRRGRWFGLTALVLVLATPVATWWLVGDQTNAEARRLAEQGERLDYAVHPVTLGPVGDRIAGIVACVAVVASLGVLAWGTRARRLDPWWWLALLPAVAAGALVGLAGRTLTAGGIGANIGAGLIIMFGCPLLAFLLLFATASALWVGYRNEQRHRSQPL